LPEGHVPVETRQKLVAGLTAERDPEILGRYVHHPAWQVRWAAIESLGKSGSPQAEGPLLAVLRTNPAIARNADERAVAPVSERVRSILSRERKRDLGGTTEVMYALEFLDRSSSSSPIAAETIRWVRAKALARLLKEERAWFETKFRT
jgi:HEAT repeat protein